MGYAPALTITGFSASHHDDWRARISVRPDGEGIMLFDAVRDSNDYDTAFFQASDKVGNRRVRGESQIRSRHSRGLLGLNPRDPGKAKVDLLEPFAHIQDCFKD